MSMVERVAAAVNEVYIKASQSPEGLEYHLARGLPLVASRATIEAMREPTDAMVSVGVGGAAGVKRRLWELMIDAALNEQVAG